MESRSKGGRHSPLSPAGCSIIPHFLDHITQTLCVDTRVCVCACVYLIVIGHVCTVHYHIHLIKSQFIFGSFSLLPSLGISALLKFFFFNNYLFFLLGKCFIHALTALGLENFIEEGHKEEMKVKTR